MNGCEECWRRIAGLQRTIDRACQIMEATDLRFLAKDGPVTLAVTLREWSMLHATLNNTRRLWYAPPLPPLPPNWKDDPAADVKVNVMKTDAELRALAVVARDKGLAVNKAMAARGYEYSEVQRDLERALAWANSAFGNACTPDIVLSLLDRLELKNLTPDRVAELQRGIIDILLDAVKEGAQP